MSKDIRRALMVAKDVTKKGPSPVGVPDREANLKRHMAGNHPDVPHVVYIGTTGDFNQFKRSRMNPASDHGQGFYASNNIEDVNNNYAGEGPDLSNRIEKYIDDNMYDRDDDEEMSPEEMREAAKEALGVQHQGMVMPVHYSIKNPVVLGGKNETFYDYHEPYNEKTEEYGEPLGKLLKVFNGIREAANQFDTHDADDLIGKLHEHATDKGGIYASELESIVKNHFGHAYDPDTGESAGNEAWRTAVEEAGHDGIIDHTVDSKFGSNRRGFAGARISGMAGVTPDTTHYVAFKPQQIKSAIGNNGDFSPTDPDITKARGGSVHPATQIPGVHISERTHGKPIFTGEREGRADGGSMSVFPKPQRMLEGDDFVQGGKYIDTSTKEDVTGHKASEASIVIAPGGKPSFTASRDAIDQTGSPGRGSAAIKANLFKQKAGWRWSQAPEGHEDTSTIVSVEHRGKHHYALAAHFPKGVELARYADAPSEPRLRPTTQGNIELGPQVGSINVRGREHPVHEHVIAKSEGGLLTGKDEDGEDGITAYQGGPHSVGPEGYSNDKLGSGQGAHNYGYGHYFAEAEPVAQDYRDTLARTRTVVRTKSGEDHEYPYDLAESIAGDKAPKNPLDDHVYFPTLHAIYEMLSPTGPEVRKSLDQAISSMRSKYSDPNLNREEEGYASPATIDKAERLLREHVLESRPGGHMHQVRIQGRPEHFLDYDKPLSEQSDHVRKALEGAGYTKEEMGAEDPLGSQIYKRSKHILDHPKVASEELSRLGIRGIRYLDQGSRNNYLVKDAPDGTANMTDRHGKVISNHPTRQEAHDAGKEMGTRNYVVFDPKHIDIQRRYARGGMAYADGGSLPDAGVQKALDLTRDLNPQGLYSHASEAAMASPQAKGPLPQMLASLKGVKPDELKYSGVNEQFAGQPRVTREELAQHFQKQMPDIQETALREWGGENRSPKYKQHTLPGGDNYREVLMHLPHTKMQRVGVLSSGATMSEEELSIPVVRRTAEKIGLTMEDRPVATGLRYKSSHWDQPNVLAHLRLKDRTGPNGEKILHAEEVQSDWGQQARRSGTYNAARPYQVFEPNTGKVLSEHASFEEARDEAKKHEDAGNYGIDYGHAIDSQTDKEPVHDAPYIGNTQNWTDLALKRLLHEAAAGGYDKVVYTPGVEQAKRYGKGDSSGMEGYYDKVLPKSLLALAKQHDPDAQLEAHGIAGLKPHLYDKDQDHEYAENLAGTELSRAQAQAFNSAYRDLRRNGTSSDDSVENALAHAMRTAPDAEASLPGLTITPRMRESINKRGFKAYARGGDVEGTMRVGKAGGGSQDDDTVKKALALTAPQKVTDHPAWIPTRLVTSKKAGPQGKNVVDLASLKATPDLYEKNVGLLKDYPNIRSQFAGSSSDDVAKEFVRHATENLLALHDAVPDHIRNRSKLWYDGARAITDRWSQEYGLPDHSIAGVLAALSPQKDWYQNVSLAKRVLNTMRGNGENFYHGFTFSPEMEATFRGRDSLNKPKYEGLLNMVRGKSLGDIDKGEGSPEEKSILKALWVRMHDETHGSPEHPIITPEGNEGELVKTAKGANAKVGWGSMTEIAKAIRAIEAQNDPDAISALMGEKHKVRNFYNNILVPNSRHGDITADTHAVAAALYRPLSGQSTEVAHNFANSTGPGIPAAGGSALTGIQGTYPLYAEAYRKAAKARGILPREMQSITWEAVRGLFPDTFKTAKNSKAVDAIWNQYKAGKIPQSEARRQVDEIAGGIRNPTWHVEGNAGPNEAGGYSNNPRELSGTGAYGEPTQAPDTGAGVGSPLAVPQKRLTEADGGAVSRALQIALQHGQPLPDAVNLARQHTRGRP